MPFYVYNDAPTPEQIAGVHAMFGTGVQVIHGLKPEWADYTSCEHCQWWGSPLIAAVGAPCPHAARFLDRPHNVRLLTEELHPDGVLLPGDPDVPIDPVAKAAADAAAAAQALIYAEQDAIARMLCEIDDEAERRIHEGPGFEFPPASGQFFSLSANAQSKWAAVMNAATTVLIGIVPAAQVYPFKVRTKDDLIEYTVADAATALNMCLTAIATAQAHLAACREAKGEVLAAPDAAAARVPFDAYMAG